MDISQTLLNSATGSCWKRIGIANRHGICIPLFSLWSYRSCGIGEYTDLIPLLKWCSEVGFEIIQLLPLNDTGLQTSPYSALSSCALNPIHIALADLPHLKEFSDLSALLLEMQQLNTLQRVNYPRVHLLKENFLRKYYALVSPRILNTDSYKRFIEDNIAWLKGYALFKAMRKEQNEKIWEEWPAHLQEMTPEKIEEELKLRIEEMTYYFFLQYLCFMQMVQVKEEAQRYRILIMGDIPILIDRDSSDVWLYREMFYLDRSAGSPPDAYSEKGQNWGFPLYNWEVQKESLFQWWRLRLKVASAFYDIYRLDHVVGLYRIWTFPRQKLEGGYFIPSDSHLWIPQGDAILRMMLEKVSMLPIGEDLGTIPNEVRASLAQLGICGIKVMRWERYWEGDRNFIPFDRYFPLSMSTVSTHDSETLDEWWTKHPEEAQEFAAFKRWSYQPLLSLEQHREILEDSHHTTSLFHINLLQEYLVLRSGMTWPHLEDERINIPGLVSERNWSYRFKPSIEALVNDTVLKEVIKNILKQRVSR